MEVKRVRMTTVAQRKNLDLIKNKATGKRSQSKKMNQRKISSDKTIAIPNQLTRMKIV